MNKNSRSCADIFARISRYLICLSLLAGSFSCAKKLNVTNVYDPTHLTVYDPNAVKWVDWNVLFKTGGTSGDRNTALHDLQQYISHYIDSFNLATGHHFAVNQFIFNCPCDSLLWNLNAEPLAGSGPAPVKPPNPPPGLGGSGDAIQYVNLNNPIIMDSSEYTAAVDTSVKIHLSGSATDASGVLAVMDTGLDSTLFENRFAGLLWNNPNGRNIRNFQFFNNGQALDYYMDDDEHKHGTAVTAIALQAMQNPDSGNQLKPRVMVLKVLDKNKTGSTFTVSCGLSYTVQEHATLVNASLGYYSTGAIDSILRYYVGLCSQATPQPIPILAAAGNLPGVHDNPLCSDPSTGNELNSGRLFFPACFKTGYANVISVTGLHTPQSACFYQNYSSTFVSVGVVTNSGSTANCCKFPVGFLSSGYEGSSFATPVVSGKMMGCLIGTPGTVIPNCLNRISTTQSEQQVTVDGRFLIYTSGSMP